MKHLVLTAKTQCKHLDNMTWNTMCLHAAWKTMQTTWQCKHRHNCMKHWVLTIRRDIHMENMAWSTKCWTCGNNMQIHLFFIPLPLLWPGGLVAQPRQWIPLGTLAAHGFPHWVQLWIVHTFQSPAGFACHTLDGHVWPCQVVLPCHTSASSKKAHGVLGCLWCLLDFLHGFQ